LLTNDDGFDAPGLAAMYAALQGLAKVSVIAPAKPASSAGHGVTDRGTIRVEHRHVEPLGPVHIVHGTPADCVRLGFMELLGHPPDWVAAGINRGGNMGVDVFYSGTVAAAREAAILGAPAVAVSQYIAKGLEVDWTRAEQWARTVLANLFAGPPEERPPIWNVNLPALPPGQEPRGTVVVPMALTPLQICYERREPEGIPAGATVYEFMGQYSQRPAPAGTDVASVLVQGCIAMTPLGLDLTYRLG
jgi:5'-nucleotidase